MMGRSSFTPFPKPVPSSRTTARSAGSRANILAKGPRGEPTRATASLFPARRVLARDHAAAPACRARRRGRRRGRGHAGRHRLPCCRPCRHRGAARARLAPRLRRRAVVLIATAGARAALAARGNPFWRWLEPRWGANHRQKQEEAPRWTPALVAGRAVRSRAVRAGARHRHRRPRHPGREPGAGRGAVAVVGGAPARRRDRR